jgi:hypothetical protein
MEEEIRRRTLNIVMTREWTRIGCDERKNSKKGLQGELKEGVYWGTIDRLESTTRDLISF